jgi:hypothetical protein
MRTYLFIGVFLACGLAFGAKKIVSNETTAANEKVDLDATITLDEDQVKQALGADPGKGIVLLKVRVTPKVDAPMFISPDDFILLAHDDGERNKPFSPAEIAGSGAMVERQTKGHVAKSGIGASLGGMLGGGGGGGLSPGSSPSVKVDAKMDEKKAGDKKLLEVLEAKAFPTKTTNEPVEGYLYFSLDGKHKLKNLEVLYRGDGGKLNMAFLQ